MINKNQQAIYDLFIGQTFTEISKQQKVRKDGYIDEYIEFKNDDYTFILTHLRECCEISYHIYVEWDLEELINSKIVSIIKEVEDITLHDDSATATTFTIATENGGVILKHIVRNINDCYSDTNTDLYLVVEDSKDNVNPCIKTEYQLKIK